MKCKLVDVFAKKKLSGNGLTIFYEYGTLAGHQMLSLTQEMRQFESIFVSVTDSSIRARIFTVDEDGQRSYVGGFTELNESLK